MNIKKIDHIVITTAQPEACIAFYEMLGFTCKSSGGRYELYAGDFKINVHIKGRELSPHALNISVGSADFCFEINTSLDTFAKEIMGNGAKIELGIVDRSGVNGAMRSIYLRDPDGALIEFCSYS